MSYNFKAHEQCRMKDCRNKRYAQVQRQGSPHQLWVCKSHVHPRDTILIYY